MSRIVVIGAGLGGLAAATRLQGDGHDVIVLEQRERPGGRAYQLKDQGYTWDTGPSLLTMPWVLEELFAAGGMDLHAEVKLRRLDPFYRIHWANEERHLDFVSDLDAMQGEIARFSERDAKAFPGFLEKLAPIYEDGIIAAGRRPFLKASDLAKFTPRMIQLGAAQPLWWLVRRHFENPRIREAFSFHSLFIGGDPYRVPAIYGALIDLQFRDGVWYADGGVYAMIEALARPLDVRCGQKVERIEHSGGHVTAVVTEGGERFVADAVVSNGDVLAAHELLGVRAPRRKLKPTMSCLLLYLGTDRTFEQLRHHTLLVGSDYKQFIGDVTRRGRLAKNFSTYWHAPSRTEPGMAAPGGDSLCALLPVPNLRGEVDWEAETDRVAEALLRDTEETFGITGLRSSIRVEHRMTPLDFRDELGAVDGNAFAVEPTLHQSAWFRQHNRDDRVSGLYHVGGGTHPGAGVPGVVLGAEVTTALVREDLGVPGGDAARRPARAAARA